MLWLDERFFMAYVRFVQLLIVGGIVFSGVATEKNSQNMPDIKSNEVTLESEVATQTIVQDSKGGEIKIVTTIRDTSWPSLIVYDPDSFYELLPQLYRDKISIREAKLRMPDYPFYLFVSVVPRQWQPTAHVVTVWHLDLFDAMTIGVQDANPAIVQAALGQIPYTKSVLASGKTTDFMSAQPFTVDGKFKIDQMIDLACDSMTTKVNKLRITKWLSSAYATSLVAPGIQNITRLLTITPVARVVEYGCAKLFSKSLGDLQLPVKSADVAQAAGTSIDNVETLVTRLAGSAAVVAVVLAHRLEHLYIGGYIKVLDLLVGAEGVTFDHDVVYKKIAQLKQKLQWFGLSNKSTDQLQAILNKL